MSQDECLSCGEGCPKSECKSSKRDCGHHCNCSWVHDGCCWCGTEFGEEMESTMMGFGAAIVEGP